MGDLLYLKPREHEKSNVIPSLDAIIQPVTDKYLGAHQNISPSIISTSTDLMKQGIESLINDGRTESSSLKEAEKTNEKGYILRTLKECDYLLDGIINAAAKLSGYERESFSRKAYNLGINLEISKRLGNNKGKFKYFKDDAVEEVLKEKLSGIAGSGDKEIPKSIISKMAKELTNRLNELDPYSLYINESPPAYKITSRILNDMYKPENLNTPGAYKAFKSEFEKMYTAWALEKNNYDLSETSKDLKMSVRNLRRKIKKHKLTRPQINLSNRLAA